MGDDEVGEIEREGKYWSYMEDGVAPVTKGIVRRRFEGVKVNKGDNFDAYEVTDVEDMLVSIITTKLEDQSSRKKSKRKKQPQGLNSVITEIVEHEVDYEEWMDDYGRIKGGVEFREGDMLEKRHPSVWIDPELLPMTAEEATATAEVAAEGGGGKGKKGGKKAPRDPNVPRKYRGKGKKTLEKERLAREAAEREKMEVARRKREGKEVEAGGSGGRGEG